MKLGTMVDDDPKVKNLMRPHLKIGPVRQFWWCHQKNTKETLFH